MEKCHLIYFLNGKPTAKSEEVDASEMQNLLKGTIVIDGVEAVVDHVDEPKNANPSTSGIWLYLVHCKTK
jgi:hypothetical protein